MKIDSALKNVQKLLYLKTPKTKPNQNIFDNFFSNDFFYH